MEKKWGKSCDETAKKMAKIIDSMKTPSHDTYNQCSMSKEHALFELTANHPFL